MKTRGSQRRSENRAETEPPEVGDTTDYDIIVTSMEIG